MMIEELVLKELADIKKELSVIKAGLRHLDERLRSTERLESPRPQCTQDIYSSVWNDKITKEDKKRKEELDRITSMRQGQEIVRKWLDEVSARQAYEHMGLILKQEGDPYEYSHPAFDYLHKAKKE